MTAGDNVRDGEKWIKILEHDLKCLQQEKPVSVDDLDLTGYDSKTRKAIINNINTMNDSYNERINLYKDMINQLKRGEPL